MKKLVLLLDNYTAVLVDETRINHYSNIERYWELSDLELRAIEKMEKSERLYVYNITNTDNNVCTPNTLIIKRECEMSLRQALLEELHLQLQYAEVIEIMD